MNEKVKQIIWYTFVIILLIIAVIGDIQTASAVLY